MSGVTGWVDFSRDLRSQQVFHEMAASMAGRGPHGSGMWSDIRVALAHRSLATVDESGTQPVVQERSGASLALVFTGAIYNQAELARSCQPMPAPSAESIGHILLQCYLKWGRQFVQRLHGMFALAIWDGRERRLVLARDRMGVQPLYYAQYPGGLLFGSEPKALLANPLFNARLNKDAIAIALQSRLALPGETPLAGLHELPGGHCLQYSEAGLSQHRYWRLSSEPHTQGFAETAEQVRGLLGEIVASQLETATGGHVGTMLSGGLDSSSVAALASKALGERGRDLHTFCVELTSANPAFVPSEIRPDIDSPYAVLAAKHIGSRHATVEVTSEDIARVLPDARRARDLPGWGQLDASMLLLFQEMRRSCTVAVTGEIADELFGGYPQFFDRRLIERAQFPWLDEGPRLANYLSQELFPHFDTAADEKMRYQAMLADVPRLDGEDAENARMREVLYVSMGGRLAVLLDRMDRMSMAAGIQVRLPFCDHRLVEYVWNVPWSMKSQGGMKGLLKAAVGDLLPQSTLTRKKSAYPHIQDSSYDRAMCRACLALLDDPRSAAAPLFDRPRLRGLIESAQGEGRAGLLSHLWVQLLELDSWMRDYRVAIH